MVKVDLAVGFSLFPSHTAVCGAGVQGFGALYAGVLPALISVAPSGAVFYGTYDLLKVLASCTCYVCMLTLVKLAQWSNAWHVHIGNVHAAMTPQA
jgi:hypothetical protein